MSKNQFEGVQLITPNTPQQNTQTTEDDNSTPSPSPGVINLPDSDEETFLDKPITPTTSEEDNNSLYSALVKELVDKGILEVDDDVVVESADDLANLFDRTINTRLEENVNGFVQNFSGAKKLFLEIEDAFDDELLAMKVARDIDYFDRVTPEVLSTREDLQRDILSRYLKLKGLSNKEIAESIEESTALAKLAEKANAALPQLKKSAKEFVDYKRAEKLQREERLQKKQAEEFESLLSSIDSLEEIIPGIELTTKHKSAIKKSMSEVAYTDPETGAQFTELGYKQYSNPSGFEQLIQFYNTLGLFEIDKKGNFKPDMSKLVKLTEKQVKRKLDELIREQQQTSIPGQKSSAGTKLNLSFWEDAFGDNQ